MEERFLHFIWQYQYFSTPLSGVNEESIEIVRPGLSNTDSGPDFFDAKIMIDGIIWAGSVEIHVKASEWFTHKHHHDKSYENTILHVVWDADQEIKRKDGSIIPTMSLRNRVVPALYDNYRKLVKSPLTIPCSKSIRRVDQLTKISTLDKVLMERLIEKSKVAANLVAQTKGDWEETTYQLMASNFGFKVNKDQFLRLSKSVPLTFITKTNNLMQTEALLFGQSGLLNGDPLDEYSQNLHETYHFLGHKLKLAPSIAAHEWKFMRMRPANFPTIRIAQLSKLLFEVKHLFSWIIESSDYKEIIKRFMLEQSEYWLSHHSFSKSSKKPMNGLGKTSVENIILNTVVPILIAYGKYIDDQTLIDRAVGFLQQIPPENNKITRMWASLSWSAKSAFDSQAQIELHNAYCQKKKCASCVIGRRLINPAK